MKVNNQELCIES